MQLAALLDGFERDLSCRLIDIAVTPDMRRILFSLQHFQGARGLVTAFYTALIHELLGLLVIQLDYMDCESTLPAADLEGAKQVYKIILADFESYHSVEQLAKLVRLNEIKLQAAFKQLYGTTVFRFSLAARLTHSYHLLSTTDYPLRVICMMVGYDDPSNFSVAFRRHYGFWPGQLQKSKSK